LQAPVGSSDLGVKVPIEPKPSQWSMEQEVEPTKLDKILDMSARMYMEAVP
jgi:hypothetical protein